MGRAAIFQGVVAMMVGSAPTGSLFCFASETVTNLDKKRIHVKIYQVLMAVPRATVRLAVLVASNQVGNGVSTSGLLDPAETDTLSVGITQMAWFLSSKAKKQCRFTLT